MVVRAQMAGHAFLHNRSGRVVVVRGQTVGYGFLHNRGGRLVGMRGVTVGYGFFAQPQKEGGGQEGSNSWSRLLPQSHGRLVAMRGLFAQPLKEAGGREGSNG